MSLVWHMVRKDLRRLRLPLGLWLVLVLAHTGLLLAAGGRVEDPANPAAFEGLRYFANTWGIIVSAVGFVLAAWLVMEDSLVTDRAFWPTRPISGGRLLAAKALGAFVMFSVGPALVLTPVWLGCGFSVSEAARAAGVLATTQGLVSAVAFAIAGVTATSGQFLVRAGGAVIVVPLGATLVMGDIFGPTVPLSGGIADSRTCLAVVLLAVTTLVVIVHQYLSRRTGRTWLIAGLGFGLMLALRFVWFWDIIPLVRSEAKRSGMDRAEISGIAIGNPSAGFLTDPSSGGSRLQGAVSGVPPHSYLRVNASRGKLIEGDTRFGLKRLRPPGWAERPPESLTRHIAGLATASLPAYWTIFADDPNGTMSRRAPPGVTRKIEIELSLTLMQGRVLGELPLRLGAELQAGASGTRITRIERTEAGLVVRLRDRACQIPRPGWVGIGPVRRSEDVFILVHRPTAFDQVVAPREVGALQINSILVGERELTLTPPTREVNGQTAEIPGWEEDAVLVQVRFQPGFTFVRPVITNPLTLPPGVY